MMEEQGTVLSTRDDRAVVRVQRGEQCASCGSARACGAFGTTERFLDIVARNPIAAEAGDRVSIAMESEKVLWLSLLTYIAPLFFLFAGALLGPTLAARLGLDLVDDLASAMSGLLFLAISFVGLWALMRRHKPGGRLSPVVVQVVDTDNGGEDPPAYFLDVPSR